MKLKEYGKTIDYDGPPVTGPSGESLNVHGVFIALILLGSRTEVSEVKMMIIEDLQNPIIIGASVLTLLRKRLGIYMGAYWHHPSCNQSGNMPLTEECFDECQDLQNALVLNPSDPLCYDIVHMVDYKNSTMDLNQISKSDKTVQTFEKDPTPIKKRLISSKYTEVKPKTMLFVPIISQKETWNDKSKSFDWIKNTEKNNLFICEPIGKSISIANMNVDQNSVILRGNSPCYPIFNYSDDTFCIHKDTELAEVFSINPGTKLRVQDFNNLNEYEEANMKEKIQTKAKDGIKFPRDPKYRVKIDSQPTRTLGGMMGESIVEDKGGTLPSGTQYISITHTDTDGQRYPIKMECHLTGKLKSRFQSHCQKHSKVFFKNPNNVPCLQDGGSPIKASLGIRTDAVLKYHKPIPLSAEHKQALRKHINAKLQNKTLIRIPRQSWASQVMVVPKNKKNADGSTSYRFVQSLIDLNKNCLFKQFEMDKPRDLLAKLPKDSKYYNFFDAADSFDSIKLHPNDIAYTAFEIPKPEGGNEFIANSRIPQGALNSSGTLVETYRRLFKNEYDTCNLINYVDDFVQGDCTQVSLLRKTMRVIERFDEVNLTLSPEKCRWFVTSGTFCNMKLEQGTTTIPLKYANKILSFAKPHDTPTLQTFLGLICFCKQYIKNYGKNVALMTDMLHSEKSKNGWAWGKEQDIAFEEIRKGVMNPMTLHLIDENAVNSELHIYTDASDRAYGIVLLQRVVDTDGKPEYRLIDMLSRIIHRNNRNVSILRKEFNSLVLSMDAFHTHFINPAFKKVFWVDSKALFLLTKNEGRSPRIHRFLSNVKSFYRPAEFRWVESSKMIADSLTRLVEHSEKHRGDKTLTIMSVSTENKMIGSSFIESDKLKKLCDNFYKKIKNPELRSLFLKFYELTSRHQVKQAEVNAMMTRSKSKLQPSIQNELLQEEIGSLMNHQKRPYVIANDRSLTDSTVSFPKRNVREATDLDRSRMYRELLENMNKPPKTAKERAIQAHKKWHLQANSLQVIFGINKALAQSIIADCSRCSQYPSPNKHPQIPDRPHTTALGPNETVCIDCLHLSECNGYKYLLVSYDTYSKFVNVIALKRLDSRHVFDKLSEMFRTTGLPSVFKCDGAAYFTSTEFKGYLASQNVLIKTISVGRSNSNRVERQNRNIRSFLNRNGTDWSQSRVLSDLVLYLNCCTNIIKSNNYGSITPYELQHGYKPDIERFLNCTKPTTNRRPTQSKVNFKTFSTELNAKINKLTIDKSRYTVGKSCHYRVFGRKSSKLKPATIISVSDETCNLKTKQGQIITRHLTDVVCSN